MNRPRVGIADHPDVGDVVERVGASATGTRSVVWSRFLTCNQGSDHRIAPVMANVVGLLLLDDPVDLVRLAQLVEELGHETLARAQIQVLRRLGDGPERALMAVLFRRLARAAPVPSGDVVDPVVTGVCRDAAVHLLIKDVVIDPLPHGRWVRNTRQLRVLMDEASIVEWRPFVAALIATPWGPHVTELLEIAEATEQPRIQHGIGRLVELARGVVEGRERRQVAEQVRRLIQLTGLPQREFAALVGTSPSRLSTYVSGKVTPSAAMLVRITRTARALGAAAEGTLSATSGPIPA